MTGCGRSRRRRRRGVGGERPATGCATGARRSCCSSASSSPGSSLVRALRHQAVHPAEPDRDRRRVADLPARAVRGRAATRSSRSSAGCVIGSTAGIVVGAITARYRSMQDSLMPFAVAASSVPILAFAPLFNNWFGLDQQLSKAMVAAALCFFPVMINTVRGLTTVDPRRSSCCARTRRPRRGVPQAAGPQRAAVHLHGAAAGRDARDDRRGRRRVLRGAAGEPRPVHRDLLRVPQLRAVVGRDRVRVRDRHRPLPPGRRRRVARHALARPASRAGADAPRGADRRARPSASAARDGGAVR